MPMMIRSTLHTKGLLTPQKLVRRSSIGSRSSSLPPAAPGYDEHKRAATAGAEEHDYLLLGCCWRRPAGVPFFLVPCITAVSTSEPVVGMSARQSSSPLAHAMLLSGRVFGAPPPGRGPGSGRLVPVRCVAIGRTLTLERRPRSNRDRGALGLSRSVALEVADKTS